MRRGSEGEHAAHSACAHAATCGDARGVCVHRNVDAATRLCGGEADSQTLSDAAHGGRQLT
jgi:hypothetical protein